MSQPKETTDPDKGDEDSNLGSPTESFYTARTASESPEKLPEAMSGQKSERSDSFHTARTRASESPKKRPDFAVPENPNQRGSQDPSQQSSTRPQDDPQLSAPVKGYVTMSDLPSDVASKLPAGRPSEELRELKGWNDTRWILLAKTVKQMKHSLFDANDPTRPEYMALDNLIRGLKVCNLVDVAAAVTACKELYPDVAVSQDRFFHVFDGKALESLYKAIRYRTVTRDFRPSDIMRNMYKSLITAYCITFREKGAGYDYEAVEKRDDALGDALIVAKWIVLQPSLVVEKLKGEYDDEDFVDCRKLGNITSS